MIEINGNSRAAVTTSLMRSAVAIATDIKRAVVTALHFTAPAQLSFELCPSATITTEIIRTISRSEIDGNFLTADGEYFITSDGEIFIVIDD